MHVAAKLGDAECCELLLAADADPGAKNFADRTPRDLAKRDEIRNLLRSAAMRGGRRAEA